MEKYKTKRSFWVNCMSLGRCMGCHQRPERSFFYKNKQFPVCARCTGVLIGQPLAIVAFIFKLRLGIIWCIALCAIMFSDWLIQKLGIKESTNIRRLITGILGGYGYASILCWIVTSVIEFIIKKF